LSFSEIFSEEQAYILEHFFVASKYTFCFPDHVIFDMAIFILRADHDNFCVYNNLYIILGWPVKNLEWSWLFGTVSVYWWRI